VNRLDFHPNRDAITVMYAPGEVIEVQQHDGSVLRLRKLAQGYAGDRLARSATSRRTNHAARSDRAAVRQRLGRRPARDLHTVRHTTERAQRGPSLCPGARSAAIKPNSPD